MTTAQNSGSESAGRQVKEHNSESDEDSEQESQGGQDSFFFCTPEVAIRPIPKIPNTMGLNLKPSVPYINISNAAGKCVWVPWCGGYRWNGGFGFHVDVM